MKCHVITTDEALPFHEKHNEILLRLIYLRKVHLVSWLKDFRLLWSL
jgi:hypothetical protein